MIELVKLRIDLKPGISVPVEVPDYELPVLAELHGEDRMIEDESVPRKKAETPFFEDAWTYLTGKYHTKDGEEAFKRVYRNEKDFKRQTKFKNRPAEQTEAAA